MVDDTSTERKKPVHLHNTRAQRHSFTRGAGATWCGKKLLGQPVSTERGIDTYESYGAEVSIAFDPAISTCAYCRKAFDAAYTEAFPEGLKSIATFRLDNPEEVARAKALIGADALRQFFGSGGSGMAGFQHALEHSADAQGDGS